MTKQVTEFTPETLGKISKDINKALQKVASKYGISVRSAGMRYTSNIFTAKIDGKVMADTLTILKVGANISVQLANMLEKHNLVATKDGNTLIDYKARNRKYPYIYTTGSDNTRYKCTEEQVKRMFGA